MKKRLSLTMAVCALTAALCVPVATARVAAESATTLRTGGSTGMQLLATALANAFNKKQAAIKVTVAGGGSGAGIAGVAAGTFDIGDSSRDKRDSDPAGLVFTPAAKEPFVVIINPKNPLKSLTKAQIKGILTGTIKRWSEVGWKAGGTIQVFSRISTSGTFASCKKLFTDDEAYTGSAPAQPSAGINRTSVANNKNGVACVTLAYLLTGQGKIKGLAVNGVAPTLQQAASGRYKYTNNQYFVTKGTPTGAARTYITWALAKAQQCSIVIKFALPLTAC
jgi:phosphate transport system substrate-binding protein